MTAGIRILAPKWATAGLGHSLVDRDTIDDLQHALGGLSYGDWFWCPCKREGTRVELNYRNFYGH